MREICYYLADDGKKFDNRWECIEYERRKALEAHRDEFQFFNYRKEQISVEDATIEDIMYIVVKTESCTAVIGDWFNSDGCLNPFNGVYGECVGTWVYGDVINKGDGWFKLEFEIEKLQTLIDEVNQ